MWIQLEQPQLVQCETLLTPGMVKRIAETPTVRHQIPYKLRMVKQTAQATEAMTQIAESLEAMKQIQEILRVMKQIAELMMAGRQTVEYFVGMTQTARPLQEMIQTANLCMLEGKEMEHVQEMTTHVQGSGRIH